MNKTQINHGFKFLPVSLLHLKTLDFHSLSYPPIPLSIVGEYLTTLI